MKNVLFPTDFTPDNIKALQFAAEICKLAKAKLFIFHAYHAPILEPGGPSKVLELPEEMVKEELEDKYTHLEKQLEKLTASSDIETEQVVRYGLAVYKVPKIIEEKNIDLVVMSTKGARGIEKIFVGSNTGDVIESVACPVLAIPEKTKYNGVKNILCATDLNNRMSERTLNQLVDFARLFEANIHFLHIQEEQGDKHVLSDKPPKTFYHIKKQVNYNHVEYKQIKGNDILSAIEEEVQKENIDVLAMTMHHRNFWRALFHKSKTKEMVTRAALPLLALHDEQRK